MHERIGAAHGYVQKHCKSQRQDTQKQVHVALIKPLHKEACEEKHEAGNGAYDTEANSHHLDGELVSPGIEVFDHGHTDGLQKNVHEHDEEKVGEQDDQTAVVRFGGLAGPVTGRGFQKISLSARDVNLLKTTEKLRKEKSRNK